MTQRRRDKDRGLLKPKQPTLPEGVGRESHQLDGHWERSKTAAEASFLLEVEAEIDDAISHAGIRLTRRALTVAEWDRFAAGVPLAQLEAERRPSINHTYDQAGLTSAQREAVSMRLEKLSFRQIAELLGIHHSSAQERYRSGMAKLRDTPPLLSYGH